LVPRCVTDLVLQGTSGIRRVGCPAYRFAERSGCRLRRGPGGGGPRRLSAVLRLWKAGKRRGFARSAAAARRRPGKPRFDSL